MGRHHDHLEPVDLLELEGLGIGRAGHAGELAVEPEVVLEGDRGDGLVFLADPDAFLRLDGLVQAVGPAPAGHGAPGELVDDDHVVAAHDVLDVLVIQRVRPERRVQVVHQADARRVVEAVALAQQPGFLHQLLGLLEAGLGQVHLARLLVGEEVALALLGRLPREARDERVDLHVQLGALLGRSRDDERRPRLVDQDRVHLVHDRVVLAALHAVLEAGCEVVAQVVEAELVVRAVGHVAGVSGPLVGLGLPARDHADREAEQAVDRAHPLGVALGEVLVDRDDVHALARECVEVHGQRRHQRLALAGAHLGNLAVVQHHAADQLHVERAQAHGAGGGLARGRERLRQDVVEALARDQARAQRVGARPELLVALRGQRVDEAVRLPDAFRVLAQQPLVTAAENPGEDVQHGPGTSGRRGAKYKAPRPEKPIVYYDRDRKISFAAGVTGGRSSAGSSACRCAALRSAGASRSNGRSSP